jgi:hypothetical protein
MCFGSGLPVLIFVSIPITSPGLYRVSGFTGETHYPKSSKTMGFSP